MGDRNMLGELGEGKEMKECRKIEDVQETEEKHGGEWRIIWETEIEIPLLLFHFFQEYESD